MDLTIPVYENIDYSKPVMGYGNFSKSILNNGKCMVDPVIVGDKFRLWNTVGNLGILDVGGDVLSVSKERQYSYHRAISLLKDKTIFAYSHFKFNGNPMKLRFYQDIAITDTSDRILFICSNQTGKSITLDVDAATDFVIDHGKEWIGILVSKSLAQSQYQMSRIKQLLKSAHIDYRVENTEDTKTGKVDNVAQITYTFYEEDGKTPRHTNRMICCPPTGSALGYPCDVMWLDEFDFWENIDQDWFVNQVALSRIIETQGKIKIFTNPNGKERYAHVLWNNKDRQGNYVWHRYNFNYWDKPGATQEQFDRLTASMTKQQIESTMLAMFSSSEGAFLSVDEIKRQFSEELAQKGDQAGYGRESAWFLDVGTVHDQSTLIGGYLEQNNEKPEFPLINAFYIHKYPVGYPLARVVGVRSEITDEDGWQDYEDDNPSVKTVLEEYASKEDGNMKDGAVVFLPLFGCDVTGNAAIVPLFQSAKIDPVAIIFSGKKKWEMYQRYQWYTQQGFLKRVKDRDNNTVGGRDFEFQASRLVIKKGTRTSYRQIHHQSEDDLDDTQDAMVGLIHLIENPDLPSLSFDIIPVISSRDNKVDGEVENRLPSPQPISPEQYIPSFYNRDELNHYIDERERNYR